MITIWHLANMESLRSIAERFGVSKSTCWDILYRTCSLVLKVNKVFIVISWPNRERQQEIRNRFSTHGFPGKIGCIDGSHIHITAPKDYPNSYAFTHYCCTCDNRKLFIDVYAGRFKNMEG